MACPAIAAAPAASLASMARDSCSSWASEGRYADCQPPDCRTATQTLDSELVNIINSTSVNVQVDCTLFKYQLQKEPQASPGFRVSVSRLWR